MRQKMRILFVLTILYIGLSLTGCGVDRPLMSDEEYDAIHGPAPYAADPMGHIPQTTATNSGGRY